MSVPGFDFSVFSYDYDDEISGGGVDCDYSYSSHLNLSYRYWWGNPLQGSRVPGSGKVFPALENPRPVNAVTFKMDSVTETELRSFGPKFENYSYVNMEDILYPPPPEEVDIDSIPGVGRDMSGDSYAWAVISGFFSGLGTSAGNMAKGGWNAGKEAAFTVVDLGGVTVDAIATVAGHPLDYKEMSSLGNSYENTTWTEKGANAARSGLAGGTAGGSEVLIGTIKYFRDGDGEAYSQHMGGVSGMNLAGAATIKVGSALRPKAGSQNKGTFIDQMTPEEAARYQKYWHDAGLERSSPGTRRWERTQSSTQGDYTYRAITHFDEFGRRVAETHYSTHVSTGVLHPNPHYHLYDRVRGKLAMMPGEYLGE